MRTNLTKAWAMLLSLAMLLTFTQALAEGESSYTLVIPESLEVSASGWAATDGVGASLELGQDFEDNKKLKVTATSENQWSLVSGSDSVGYNLSTENSGYDSAAEPAFWEFNKAQLTESVKKKMGINIGSIEGKPSGTYTDTVTFSAEVLDAGTPIRQNDHSEGKGESVYLTNGMEITTRFYWNDLAGNRNTEEAVFVYDAEADQREEEIYKLKSVSGTLMENADVGPYLAWTGRVWTMEGYFDGGDFYMYVTKDLSGNNNMGFITFYDEELEIEITLSNYDIVVSDPLVAD